MPLGFDLFASARINKVYQGLMDPRQLPQQLMLSKRVPMVDALASEITARFIGYSQIADLLADDSRAVVYNTGKYQMETTKIPKLKIGANMPESTLAQILMINANTAFDDSLGFFRKWESNTLFNLKLGLAQRIEVLLSAMYQDSFVYDRLGIKISASWGMPSDLKLVVSTAWDNIAATPVTDIQLFIRNAQVRYGVYFNRLTMSLAAFNYMIATTEFQNRAKVFLPIGFTLPAQYNTANIGDMQGLAGKVLGLQLVLYDGRYWSQDESGVPSMFPFWPINKVLVDNSDNDGNGQVHDVANTTVVEAMVASLGGEPIGAQNAPGPLSYVTFPENLNPPELTYWAVQRCFPRKHVLQGSGVITVGSFVDPISSNVPF